MDQEELISIIADWAKSETLIREAYLFGSRARGDHSPDSDVDIAVKMHKQPSDGSEYASWFFEADKLKERVQERISYPVQLEWYDPVETPHVHKGIVESSIKVYDENVT